MRVFGLAGWSGSGKTTLMERLIAIFVERGVTVSTIKHAHHRFDVDRPGKDSYRHREAGASEVLISSELRWALLHEHRGAAEPSLDALIAKLSPVDLVLVEGFKSHAMDKLEVHRPSLGHDLMAPRDPHVVAVASDAPVDGADVPVLPLNDPAAVADFIGRHCRLAG